MYLLIVFTYIVQLFGLYKNLLIDIRLLGLYIKLLTIDSYF